MRRSSWRSAACSSAIPASSSSTRRRAGSIPPPSSASNAPSTASSSAAPRSSWPIGWRRCNAPTTCSCSITVGSPSTARVSTSWPTPRRTTRGSSSSARGGARRETLADGLAALAHPARARGSRVARVDRVPHDAVLLGDRAPGDLRFPVGIGARRAQRVQPHRDPRRPRGGPLVDLLRRLGVVDAGVGVDERAAAGEHALGRAVRLGTGVGTTPAVGGRGGHTVPRRRRGRRVVRRRPSRHRRRAGVRGARPLGDVGDRSAGHAGRHPSVDRGADRQPHPHQPHARFAKCVSRGDGDDDRLPRRAVRVDTDDQDRGRRGTRRRPTPRAQPPSEHRRDPRSRRAGVAERVQRGDRRSGDRHHAARGRTRHAAW